MRCLRALVVTLTLLCGSVAAVAAQGGNLGVAQVTGYPELKVTVGDRGITAPARFAGGWVLYSLTNQTTAETVELDLLRLPPGVSEAALRALSAPPSGSPAAAPSPLPSWLYRATIAGGLIAPAGRTVQAALDLSPGDWYLWAGPATNPQPKRLVVTAAPGTPPTTQALAPEITVQLRDFAFAGLTTPVTPGQHLWKITNVGKQPHMMRLVKAPAGITRDQVLTLLKLPANATPPPGFPYKESDFDFAVPSVGVLSPGQTDWAILDLQPGTYVALCFVPDEKTGVPHALMGMLQIFTVSGGSGTPVGTPRA